MYEAYERGTLRNRPIFLSSSKPAFELILFIFLDG